MIKRLRKLLKQFCRIGEDPNREGLQETPKRVVKAFKEYLRVTKKIQRKYWTKLLHVEGYDDMVIQKNISYKAIANTCSLLLTHVAYIPKERVVGLSKLARVVEVFSKITDSRKINYVANTLMESLDARRCCTIDSTHQCMTMRGIKKEQASTVTNYYLGQFKEDLSWRQIPKVHKYFKMKVSDQFKALI